MTQASTATEFSLVPPGTLVEASGEGESFPVASDGPRIFVLRLEIAEVVEQESLDLSLWGSPDGQEWGSMPLLKFPQQFYRGTARMVLDLTSRAEIRFIRARWDLNRWGRGRPLPRFRFGVTASPVEARNA
ncbi:MAG: hypothetical protein ACE5IP_05040 [Terriglobia bacterium]